MKWAAVNYAPRECVLRGTFILPLVSDAKSGWCCSAIVAPARSAEEERLSRLGADGPGSFVSSTFLEDHNDECRNSSGLVAVS